ncbi:ATP-grasp domain-containing protein [Pyxidicoccus sp. 3LG]
MRILFPSDSLSPRNVDDAFAAEAEAARACGWERGLVSYEALTQGGSLEDLLVGVPRGGVPEKVVYRGWMLRPEQYLRMNEALQKQGLVLVTSPEAYAHGHHLPGWYDAVKAWTPRSVWTRAVGAGAEDEWMRLLEGWGDRPVLVKDFVKSRKHEWAEACFIPSARDRAAVSRVTRRFLELQGEDLNEGLVFREYVELVPLEAHPRSGMPRVREFRVFVLGGRPLLVTPYWDDVDGMEAGPVVEAFAEAFAHVRSPFFTADVAQRKDGTWTLIEIGDGQVSGLPERANLHTFFSELKSRLEPSSC